MSHSFVTCEFRAKTKKKEGENQVCDVAPRPRFTSKQRANTMQACHYVSASALANRLRRVLEQSGGQARAYTSILALLRGLCLLGEAGVQPRGRLRVVTAKHQKKKKQSELLPSDKGARL